MKSPTYKVWPMISVFWYLPTYVMYAKILAHIYDHVQQFYSNCWTLYVSSLSEKTVKTLWHYEDHWYIFKKEEDLEETPAAPHVKALCFRVKSIYCYKLLSVREVGRKTTIGYILYSKKWKFMKQYVMLHYIKCFLQVNKDSTNKNFIIYCLFNIFNKANYCMCGRKRFLKSKLYLYRIFWSFKNPISLLYLTFLSFYPDLIAERWVYS